MFSQEIFGNVDPFVVWCYKTEPDHCPPPGKFYPERYAKAYELDLVSYVDGGYIIIDGTKYDLEAGNILFRKPGMRVQGHALYHSYTILFLMVHSGKNFALDPANHSEGKEMYLDLVCKDYYDYTSLEKNLKFPLDFPIIMKTSEFDKCRELFEAAFKEHSLERPQTSFFLKTYLMQIFLLMFKELSTTNLKKHSKRSIRVNYQKIFEVKNYIDENIKLRFSLEKLARIALLSPYYFSKIFKDIVGLPPIEYVNKSKINAIKNVLITTNKEIKEIAYEYGFENETYFFKFFKKYQGSTPSSYRTLNQSHLLYM